MPKHVWCGNLNRYQIVEYCKTPKLPVPTVPSGDDWIWSVPSVVAL